MRAIDRSEVVAEVYPGATNDVMELIVNGGGLVCEDHPWIEWGEGSGCCGAPGMIKADAVRQGLLNPDGSRLDPAG